MEEFRNPNRGGGGGAGGESYGGGGASISSSQGNEALKQADACGHTKGVNHVLDKRIVVSLLHNRCGELRRNAEGFERLAQLIGAASDHDYLLFSAVLTLLERR